MKLIDAMIAWNPGTDQIAVGPWPDKSGWSRGYRMTVGACLSEHRKSTPWEQRAQLFMDFHAIVVRDRCDPQAAHLALLAIDEYRLLIAPDLPGADFAGELDAVREGRQP